MIRVGLVHALHASIAPVEAVFASEWPEAMIETTLQDDVRLALLATLQDTVDMITRDLERHDRAGGLRYRLETRLVEGALDSLMTGDRETHDRLIAEKAEALDACDSMLMGQFSIAPEGRRLRRRPGPRILTSPGCAVSRLKALLECRASGTADGMLSRT